MRQDLPNFIVNTIKGNKKVNASAYERIQAPVKFYSRERGYGFFKREDKLDVFFTNKALEKAGITNVKENEWFSFDLIPVEGKGGKAINIKKVNKNEG